MLPTLPLLSEVWHGLLRRLEHEEEPDLIRWLRAYERPPPPNLHREFANCNPMPTYLSFWIGFRGCVPGTGGGSQSAEAQHAPWQRRPAALAGKGDVAPILGVLQKLYDEHWQHWYDWASETPLRLRVEDVCHVRAHPSTTLNTTKALRIYIVLTT